MQVRIVLTSIVFWVFIYLLFCLHLCQSCIKIQNVLELSPNIKRVYHHQWAFKKYKQRSSIFYYKKVKRFFKLTCHYQTQINCKNLLKIVKKISVGNCKKKQKKNINIKAKYRTTRKQNETTQNNNLDTRAWNGLHYFVGTTELYTCNTRVCYLLCCYCSKWLLNSFC